MKFRLYCFFILINCIVLACYAETSIKSDAIQWLNPLGEHYSIMDKTGYFSQGEIQIENTVNGSMSYFIGVDQADDQGLRYLSNDSGDQISYYLTSAPNVRFYLSDWPNIKSVAHTYDIQLKSQIKTIPVFVWIEPRQVVSSGLYKSELGLTLYKGNFDSSRPPEVISNDMMTIQVIVNEQVSLNFSDEIDKRSRELKISYHDLQKEGHLVFDVVVDSNEAHKLTVNSKNNGYLMDNQKLDGTVIPYTLFIRNKRWDFNESGTVSIKSKDEDGVKKHYYKLKVVLGQVPSKLSGKYFDSIKVEIETVD